MFFNWNTIIVYYSCDDTGEFYLNGLYFDKNLNKNFNTLLQSFNSGLSSFYPKVVTKGHIRSLKVCCDEL